MVEPNFTFKLKNGFLVHDFLNKLKGECDFLFSKSDGDEKYVLLNITEFGVIDEEEVKAFIANGKKILIINTTHKRMDVYNINEEMVNTALLEMR